MENKSATTFMSDMKASGLQYRQFKYEGGESCEDLAKRATNFMENEVLTKFVDG